MTLRVFSIKIGHDTYHIPFASPIEIPFLGPKRIKNKNDELTSQIREKIKVMTDDASELSGDENKFMRRFSIHYRELSDLFRKYDDPTADFLASSLTMVSNAYGDVPKSSHF